MQYDTCFHYLSNFYFIPHKSWIFDNGKSSLQESKITRHQYGMIRNYVSHGVGRVFHTDPIVHHSRKCGPLYSDTELLWWPLLVKLASSSQGTM